MAKIIDCFNVFLNFFKRKGPQTIPKDQKARTTGPKQPANQLKGKEVMDLRAPQKSAEKGSDPKIVKAPVTSKPLPDERERKIELVGHYLGENRGNLKPNGVPVRPLRNFSTNDTNVKTLMKSSAKNTSPNVNSKDKQLNQSFDSKTEMTSNRVIKIDEKLQKNSQQLKTKGSNAEQLKGDSTHKDSDQTLKSNFDLIDSKFSHLKVEESKNSSPNRSHKSENQMVSGLVPIKQIDLKTAKCFVCLRLVSKNITIAVCSHIFCMECMQEWTRLSQHCPQCRNFIWSYGYAIRTQSDRVYICSEKDYKVKRIAKVDNFVDSLGAAYLFEAFVLNRKMSAYLDSNIAAFQSNITDLESKLSANRNVQLNVNIRYSITQQIHKLEEFRQKKTQSDLSYKDICEQTNPQMLSFWNKVLSLRQTSESN